MDRLTRTLAGLGLASIAAAGGCRSAHDEVPPGKVYRPDSPQGAVGFSTTPAQKAPGTFGAPATLTQGNIGGGGMLGSQPPGGDLTGTVPGNRFGGPGTSGAASPSPALTPTPSTSVGSSLSGLGGAPPLQPSATPREDPNYLNGFSAQPPAAGAMGSPGQPPSPL